MSKRKIVILLSVVFTILVGVSAYVAANADGQSSELPDASDGTTLEVPILTGTWDVELEFYEASSFPGVYGSGSLVLVLTEQTRQVFTGYCQEPGDPYVDYINGAVVGHSIRIGGYDISFTGTLDSNDIIGTYSNIPLAPDDDDYETGTFIARKQVE